MYEKLTLIFKQNEFVITEDRGGYFIHFYQLRMDKEEVMTIYLQKKSEYTIITSRSYRDHRSINELFLKCMLAKFDYDQLRKKRVKTPKKRRIDSGGWGCCRYEWSKR